MVRSVIGKVVVVDVETGSCTCACDSVVGVAAAWSLDDEEDAWFIFVKDTCEFACPCACACACALPPALSE